MGEGSAHRWFCACSGFRGALGGDLSGHVSQEAGRHGFPPTLEKLRRELLAYEGAPGVIRWGGALT